VTLAAREGYTSVEHLKRYTTLGMGTDQGKTSNVIGPRAPAQAIDKPIPDVGTTTFRPPYAPDHARRVAGGEQGAHLAPTRRTAMHAWHAAQARAS
jgi:sarcosine oxidase subunit alpha